MPKDGVHLSDLTEELGDGRSDTPDEQDAARKEEPEQLPWRMVGTLYNNLSIVVKVTILGGISTPSILFPGDLSDWTTLVLRQLPNLKADILKMPHHGSKNVTCDLQAIRDAMDYPWYWLYERYYPFFHSSLAPLSRAELRRFFYSVRHGDPLSVISDIVTPSHVLVFPHPQHHLPSIQLGQFHSTLIANRSNRDVQALNQKDNAPSPARILVGLERHDVREL